MRSPPPRDRWPTRVLLAFALAASAGGAVGCITAFAPNIRREDHHGAMTQRSRRGDCLTCHESESQMTRRMKHMHGAELQQHIAEMTRVIRPPLVQDWMVTDRRGCVDCHRVKEAR